MTLMDNAYLNPPVDKRLYFSEAQTVTADALSTNQYDAQAAGLFPSLAYLVIEPVTLGTGEALTVEYRQSANSNMGSHDVLWSHTFSASTTEQLMIPLSNTLVTKRYSGPYYNVSTGDSIPITSYLSTR